MIPKSERLNLKFHNLFNAQIFSFFTCKFMPWFRYNFCFCKEALFVAGLVFSYKFVDLDVLQVFITYFTYSSSYNLKKAAAFVNFQEGLSASLAFIYRNYAFLSHLKLIICSAVSFICGLLVLCFTALQLFPESKTDIFNIIGVVLLAVGEPGLPTFLKACLSDQLRAQEPKPFVNEDRVQARRRMWWIVAWFCSVPAVFFVYNASWPTTFIISASIMGTTLILFLLGIRVYPCKESAGRGRRLSIFSVVMASIQKWKLDYPNSPDQFFGNDRNQLCLLPRIKFLRRLDKSAIIESSNLSPGEQRNAGRLCTVREVRKIKLLFKMIPLWINFLVLGLLLSTGDTFFPEQGNKMIHENLFKILLIIRSISRIILGFLLKLLVRKWDTKTKKQAQIFKIWAGMMLCVYCCIVAWRVEVHRLNIVNKEGLLDQPDVDIPMSIFWLAPQYILLGLTEALAIGGLNEFVTYEFPESTQEYVKSINDFVIGIGSFLNILCVHLNGSLFSDTLNHSHLDKYYERMTVVSFINFCTCYFISMIYESDRGRLAVDEITQTEERRKHSSHGPKTTLERGEMPKDDLKQEESWMSKTNEEKDDINNIADSWQEDDWVNNIEDNEETNQSRDDNEITYLE